MLLAGDVVAGLVQWSSVAVGFIQETFGRGGVPSKVVALCAAVRQLAEVAAGGRLVQVVG